MIQQAFTWNIFVAIYLCSSWLQYYLLCVGYMYRLLQHWSGRVGACSCEVEGVLPKSIYHKQRAFITVSFSQCVCVCVCVCVSVITALVSYSLTNYRYCPISYPHRQTWLFSSTSTYHSTDLLTTHGVAHLVVHGTSGSTSYETIPPVRLESSGGCLLYTSPSPRD